MYRASVLLLMLILPAASIYAGHSYLQSSAPLMELVGKWFVFWSAGVRLLLAGLSQFFRPRFTSEGIFGMESDDPLPFVQELGAANFATGFVGVASLAKPSFVLPVAIKNFLWHCGHPASAEWRQNGERKYRDDQRSVRISGPCHLRRIGSVGLANIRTVTRRSSKPAQPVSS
jgi:hypothetical protein